MAAPGTMHSLCQLVHAPRNTPETPPWLIAAPNAGELPEPPVYAMTRTLVGSKCSVPPVPEKATVSIDPKATEWFAQALVSLRTTSRVRLEIV